VTSPERTALAVAIAAKVKADEAATQAQQRLDRARALVAASQAKHDEALASLGRARDRHALLIESGGAGAAVKAARETLASAEDDLIAATAALGKLSTSTDEPAYQAHKATLAVTAAAQGVVVDETVDALLAEAAALRTELDLKLSLLREIGSKTYETHRDASRKVEGFLHAAAPLPYEFDQRLTSPAVTAWRAALDALTRDPSQPLPGFEVAPAKSFLKLAR
jgi:hypothetical protein